MKTFQILPTDPKFTELTEGHYEFIHQSLDVDIEERKKAEYRKKMAAVDPSFAEEKDENGNPLYPEDGEHFYDPEFDEAWNDTDQEFDDTADIGENPSDEDFENYEPPEIARKRKALMDSGGFEEV